MTTRAGVEAFDHHSEDFARNWREVYRHLRTECPVASSDRHGGYHVITRYDDVLAILRDAKSASSGREMMGTRPASDRGVTIPPNPFRMGTMEMDPPACTRYRRILNPWFSRQAVDGLIPRLRSLVTWCIDRFIESGTFDVVDELANPLPALVTLDLLGIPLDRWFPYARAMHEAVYRQPGSADAIRWMLQDVTDVVEEGGEAGGLIEHLRSVEMDGERLTIGLVVELVFMILNGGTDTTTALIAHLLFHLDRHPVHRDQLIADRKLLSPAVQEVIRVYAPATGVARTVTAPITVAGVSLDPGTRLFLALGSANGDEARFPNADQVVIDRQPNPHLAFGSGLHRCLGAELAVTEMEVLLDELLTRLPDFRIDRAGVVGYPTIPLVNGFVSMPARFSPGKRLLDQITPHEDYPVLQQPRCTPGAVAS